MFYKLLGMAVWKFGTAYVRRNYGRQLRLAAIAGIATIAVAGYLATRSGE
jgi:hypothetical protein